MHRQEVDPTAISRTEPFCRRGYPPAHDARL